MPLSTKIKRLLVTTKGKYVHGLYPDEYFSRPWLNKKDSNCVKIYARIMRTTQKQALHMMVESAIKQFEGALVEQELDDMDTPKVAPLKQNIRAFIWNYAGSIEKMVGILTTSTK